MKEIAFWRSWRFKTKDLIGLDWGHHSAKIVQIKKDPTGSLVLARLACQVNHSSLGDFVQAEQMSGFSVACNLEEENLHIRRVEIPPMPESDLEQAIRWMVKDSVEGNLDQYAVRSLLLDDQVTSGGKKQVYLAFVVSRKILLDRMVSLRRLGFSPVSLEPSATALLASFDASEEWEVGKKYVLLDIGGSQSSFFVFSDQKLLYHHSLTGVSAEPPGGGKDETLLKSFYGQLAVDVQRAVDSFSVSFHREKVDKIFLCGGGALLPRVDDYLTKNMGIETVLFDPFQRIQRSSHQDSLLAGEGGSPKGDSPKSDSPKGGSLGLRPIFATAVGLALMEGKR
ncbi:MAG: pilus assembly protein PilM [Deltaproteobacteria bacterium]|nr:pilus assembly protein PilM [Deltaproteobacteria bacterium]